MFLHEPQRETAVTGRVTRPLPPLSWSQARLAQVSWGGLVVLAVAIVVVGLGANFLGKRQGEKQVKERFHIIPGFAWDKAKWAEVTKDIRTSYNPDGPLNSETLTLVPGDPRWLDFIYWCFNNRLAEHQVEAYGGTEWEGPQGGVLFHWAPGSRWETHTLASFGFTVGHVIGEHRWMDTMFPEFFEQYAKKYGSQHAGVYGVNMRDRLYDLDPKSPIPYVEFLEYCGGSNSPYYRYLFHQEAAIDPIRERIYFIGGQGVGFEYTYERYYHEVREVLTDAKAFQFFQMFDMYGPGFACKTGWAHSKIPGDVFKLLFPGDEKLWPTKPGVGWDKSVRPWYNPNPTPPEIPADLPDVQSAKRGEMLYKQQCAVCHGALGDGKGPLWAGFDVKPRDFRSGDYLFRSTKAGQLPTFEDLEKTIRIGVPGTTMPAWGQFLKDEEIKDVARYLAVFSPRFMTSWKKGHNPAVLTIPEPPADLAAMAGEGAQIFKKQGCAACHGEQGKGDGPSSTGQKDSWGHPMAISDLTYKWLFKNGPQAKDIYRSVFTGLNGTPMPSSEDTIKDDKERWALVAHVMTLSPEKRPVLQWEKTNFIQRLQNVIDKKGIVRK